MVRAFARLVAVGSLLALPISNGLAQPPSDGTAEEIIVTAKRTGAPVWRVRSEGATLVLVGSIDDVTEGTDWRPAALAETVRKSHRVMFPEMAAVNLSPFALVDYLARWKRRKHLPNGQSLSAMLSGTDAARLRQLSAMGLAPTDYDRWHPLHLAFNMQDRLRKRTRMMEEATTTVARAASRFKVSKVPIERSSARPLADSLFRSQPAGPPALPRRDDWRGGGRTGRPAGAFASLGFETGTVGAGGAQRRFGPQLLAQQHSVR